MSNKNEIIDFNSKFMQDFIEWSNKHPEIARDEDLLDEAAAKAKAKWYASKKSWLQGLSPNDYFFNIEDAAKLVSLFIGYIEEDYYIPEPLIDCIIDGGKETYEILTGILNVGNTDDISDENLMDLRAQIISLIEEMRMPHPYSRYVSLLLEEDEPCALTEAITTALEDADDTEYIRSLLFGAYPLAEGISRLFILDILCDLPDDDLKTADIVLAELNSSNIEMSVLAGYEATLTDERSLPILRAAIDDPQNDYYTYSQIRFAIEAITGELIDEKDFTGDDDYDKIANLTEDQIFG